MSLRTLLLVGILSTAVLAFCNPRGPDGRTASGPDPDSAGVSPSAGSVTPTSSSTETSSTAESDSARPKPDWSRCALPPELIAEGWPRRLGHLTEADPSPPPPGTVSLAVLPDTQYYTSCRSEHLPRQGRFVATQAKMRNIAATLHLGDLTEHNAADEWRFVAEALDPIASAMPLLVTTGNHDYGLDGTADERHTRFAEYFGRPEAPTRAALVTSMTPGDVENAYYRVELGKATIGVLLLGWSPTDQMVAWAKRVLAEHPDDRVIFITHAYLYYDGTRYDWAKHGTDQDWNVFAYGTAKKDPRGPATDDNLIRGAAHDGQMLWEELLVDHPGVFLTLNGHVLGDGAGLLSSRGNSGNLVHQMLSNYQMLDEAGLGYLRLLEFLPNGRSLRVKTYSPSLQRYSLDPEQHFELTIDPPLW